MSKFKGMLKPSKNRILVKQDAPEEVTAGGIIIPEDAREKMLTGTVLSVGEQAALDTGIAKGNRILFSRYASRNKEVLPGTLILDIKDIGGVIEGEIKSKEGRSDG